MSHGAVAWALDIKGLQPPFLHGCDSGQAESAVMSVFKGPWRIIPLGFFSFRLSALMQACAVEGGR
jgi:hypothetical protein